jgi:hypothetical protein
LASRLRRKSVAQAQSIEPDRVLGIVFAPFIVRELVQGLQGILIVGSEAMLDEPLRNAGRVGDAEIGGFQNGA